MSSSGSGGFLAKNRQLLPERGLLEWGRGRAEYKTSVLTLLPPSEEADLYIHVMGALSSNEFGEVFFWGE